MADRVDLPRQAEIGRVDDLVIFSVSTGSRSMTVTSSLAVEVSSRASSRMRWTLFGNAGMRSMAAASSWAMDGFIV
jgi:hypothetical protein